MAYRLLILETAIQGEEECFELREFFRVQLQRFQFCMTGRRWALGTSDARDSDLGNGFQVTGTIGRHLTRRIAIEAEVGGGNFEIAQPASSHNLNLLFLSVNLEYVAAGANIGGGLEYLLAPNTAMTVQTRYHAVSDVLTVRTRRASFSTVSLGFRRYF